MPVVPAEALERSAAFLEYFCLAGARLGPARGISPDQKHSRELSGAWGRARPPCTPAPCTALPGEGPPTAPCVAASAPRHRQSCGASPGAPLHHAGGGQHPATGVPVLWWHPKMPRTQSLPTSLAGFLRPTPSNRTRAWREAVRCSLSPAAPRPPASPLPPSQPQHHAPGGHKRPASPRTPASNVHLLPRRRAAARVAAVPPSPAGLSGQGLYQRHSRHCPVTLAGLRGGAAGKPALQLSADSTPQRRRLLGEHVEPRGRHHGVPATTATLASSRPAAHRDGAPPRLAQLSPVQATCSAGTGTLLSLRKA
ncbi:uncharacterized protein LOC142417393 [Mycteria americana]|uniref:uncharacterized protein LOC142417393 n=1 Tax=Mycteria americana TaxID=33587 RepID=UPI003F587D29